MLRFNCVVSLLVFFFFKQKTGYDGWPSSLGSEIVIRGQFGIPTKVPERGGRRKECAGKVFFSSFANKIHKR